MLVLGAAAVLTLAGCGAQDSTGQLRVTVSSTAAQGGYEVEVLAASTDRVSEHQRVFPGGTAEFAGVPLGRVTVRAHDLCTQHTTVGNGAVAAVTLSTTGC